MAILTTIRAQVAGNYQLVSNPRIISFVCDDPLATVMTAAYLNQNASGTFLPTDLFLIQHSEGINFFKSSFDANNIITLSIATEVADGDITTAKLADSAVTAVKLAADAVTTVKILNSNVTLAKLATGITPSHVIKFAGKFSNGGGSATITITGLTGMTATNYIGFANIQASTNAVTVQKVTPGTDQMVVLLSGDPGTGTVLSYQALLAAA